jgi:site-specific DNA-methyltransferase (adenine-specific)
MKTTDSRAPRNRTLTLSEADVARLKIKLVPAHTVTDLEDCLGHIVCGDSMRVLPLLPPHFIDLLVVDPPYNLTKSYNGSLFRSRSTDDYESWLHSWLSLVSPLLKSTASVYVCSEWRSSGVIQRVLEKYFLIRNRITWEREKGRGALGNWKNCSEDIWFCTVSDDYFFNAEAVKQKRRVIAPYRDEKGKPKDWREEVNGGFRVTHSSNLWTDISVPFWSMPENTDHPTQKPEKLIAKLVLASSKPGDMVFDPFLGSGTTSVVAKKLGRQFVGIEIEEAYCLLAERRLELANANKSIQGYSDGCFWERNTLALQHKGRSPSAMRTNQSSLFETQT